MRGSKTLISGVLAGVLVFGVAACGGDDEESESTTTTAAASGSTTTAAAGGATTTAAGGSSAATTVNIDAADFAFSPATMTVKRGTTVTWTNREDVFHTVTSGANRTADGKFDGNIASTGDTFSYTFNEVGTFEYYCKPHRNMNATITVTA